MRKKKWVIPFLENEEEYLVTDAKQLVFNKEVYLEIGMGMGDFITESACQHKDVFYLGLEKDETCVARAIKKAKEKELDNFKVLLADATNIEEIFNEHSVDLIYLHFSDPWPKKHHHKRRLTYMPFLSKYEKILKEDGALIYKTDNESFFNDSLEYFEQSNFKLIDINRNYYVEGEPMTAYQAKFVAEGKPIFYAKYKLG
ncbi:MAG: tRNA (guanosine(46)-N7)-methyltransferase TrmB [Erysipelotrichaceae bacterium]|nr:tRNA (guanosine(46)-N7)-methyltransferase TrmB [Erysipelotrichaceae bacterium]